LISNSTCTTTARRDGAWAKQHEWGSKQMEAVIHDFGGFYRKVGQICGTAKQMMPDAYLECFSRTMDNNPVGLYTLYAFDP
jgi:aarF domain-containing kinase